MADPTGVFFFTTTFSRYRRTLYWEGMSDAIEHEIPQTADNSNKTELIGRESDVVPGRFGEPLQVTHVQYSRGGGNATPKRPLFLCLHGWGSNEADLADMMRYIAPYNDYASLRAPLTLQAAGTFTPGAYSWFHDCVPSGEDLDRDAFAASMAIDDWVSQNVPEDRAVVPIGFPKVACWRSICCACIRNATVRRFHCPDSLRLGSSAAPRLPTTVSRRSIFPRSSVTATAIR